MKNESSKFAIVIALSIAMLGATIAVGIPNTVQAQSSGPWCWIDNDSQVRCWDSKSECLEDRTGDSGTGCFKTILP